MNPGPAISPLHTGKSLRAVRAKVTRTGSELYLVRGGEINARRSQQLDARHFRADLQIMKTLLLRKRGAECEEILPAQHGRKLLQERAELDRRLKSEEK